MIGVECDIVLWLYVVLFGLFNCGMFGGDGVYGEVKFVLDVVVSCWYVELFWVVWVSLVYVFIGWICGIGLMGYNDVIVVVVEEVGVIIYLIDEMVVLLFDLCDVEFKVVVVCLLIKVDLIGGLVEVNFDMVELVVKVCEQMLVVVVVDEDVEVFGVIVVLLLLFWGFIFVLLL